MQQPLLKQHWTYGRVAESPRSQHRVTPEQELTSGLTARNKDQETENSTRKQEGSVLGQFLVSIFRTDSGTCAPAIVQRTVQIPRYLWSESVDASNAIGNRGRWSLIATCIPNVARSFYEERMITVMRQRLATSIVQIPARIPISLTHYPKAHTITPFTQACFEAVRRFHEAVLTAGM